ncbi:MAG TPA: hypothetical protein VFQ44_14420 [Streptosporangiaceae bacterium]|nr:hypothetical protein [Streptosporangiaceae bacterium]
MISIEADPLAPAPDSQPWRDVPVAEVSELDTVAKAQQACTQARAHQRRYL